MRVHGRQREHPLHFDEHQHPFRAERWVNRRQSSSLSPFRHSHCYCRHRSPPSESTFLRSLRSISVTRLHCYYGRSDSCSLRFFGTWSMNSGSFSEQLSLLHVRALPYHSVSNPLIPPCRSFPTLPLTPTVTPFPFGVGLRHWNAGSSRYPAGSSSSSYR